MKKIYFILTLALCAICLPFTGKAQTSGGFDTLGIWAYVTLDPQTTPVVDGYYSVQFPAPPERVVRIDGPGQPVVWNNYNDGYVHLYIKKNLFDIEVEGINTSQVEFEMYVERWASIPGGGTAQCYYMVVMCMP